MEIRLNESELNLLLAALKKQDRVLYSVRMDLKQIEIFFGGLSLTFIKGDGDRTNNR
jgi:hypothetical protein